MSNKKNKKNDVKKASRRLAEVEPVRVASVNTEDVKTYHIRTKYGAGTTIRANNIKITKKNALKLLDSSNNLVGYFRDKDWSGFYTNTFVSDPDRV